MILVDVYIPAIDEVLDFELDEHASLHSYGIRSGDRLMLV